ncbi:hypothetical protein GOP47_0020583 [Adiantum capillus-veneris]|uniref:Uncharacterized protein n=1 Tax=Adiantum capillus-veneris TaxID=13818 RepID=A0A9D4U9F4_ADICA|nr:hypothetical protein GOP47_0020583 [Adiantum capillus-veneris]
MGVLKKLGKGYLYQTFNLYVQDIWDNPHKPWHASSAFVPAAEALIPSEQKTMHPSPNVVMQKQGKAKQPHDSIDAAIAYSYKMCLLLLNANPRPTAFSQMAEGG